MKHLPKGKDIELVVFDSKEYYYLFVKIFGYKFPKLTKMAYCVRNKLNPTRGHHLKKRKHKKKRNLKQVHATGMYIYRSELFHFIRKGRPWSDEAKQAAQERRAKKKQKIETVPTKRINTHGGVVFMDQIDLNRVELCHG